MKRKRKWYVLCLCLAVAVMCSQVFLVSAEPECTCEIDIHEKSCPLALCTCDLEEHTEECPLYGLPQEETECICQLTVHALGCPLATVSDSEATPTPEVSVTPEATPTPEVSVTPEVTPTPEVSVTPEVTPTPKPTVSPEVTPAPTTSVAPVESPSVEPETPLQTPESTPNPQESWGPELEELRIALETQVDQQIQEVCDQLGNGKSVMVQKELPDFAQVLAVYAVLTQQEAAFPEGIILTTSEEQEAIATVFWNMVQISGASNSKGAVVTVRPMTLEKTILFYDLLPEDRQILEDLNAQISTVHCGGHQRRHQ